ncbi:ABC transporter permease [Dictyobacter arantiisoli]|uniref:ABC-2 type transporter transmembrane domain-containing protein n=1 Tax=Dictyobacter arantiisoli TaxID=2014874 RepID=A0A5A5T9C0_9CHLR|nr:ABC transporter permease [Dictyobacter arantiisoli]GCF07766.1 hypothetical protein KDI_13300 [Dictyobacter arantiisoli]
MTLLSLVTKEMRLRLRRERSIWIIITYVLFMGLLGWLFLNNVSNNYTSPTTSGLSDVGTSLYTLLSQLQLFMIIFITPSLTATAINGEKERQTYEMLLCSRLSAFSLVLGKLGAGLINALLLIAASIPLFSLVFFFGGVAPTQVASSLLMYIVTALWLGALGIFCSTVFQRPAVSTVITYLIGLIWLLFPLILSIILLTSNSGYQFFLRYPTRAKLFLVWNPFVALSTSSASASNPFSTLLMLLNFGGYGNSGNSATPFYLGSWHLTYWTTYILISLGFSLCFFLLSMWMVKPRQHRLFKRKVKLATNQPENSSLSV